MMKLKYWLISSILLMSAVYTWPIYATTHKFVAERRSDVRPLIQVTQGFDGEFGQFSLETIGDETISRDWMGYGVRTGIGVETMRFIQFNAFHILHDSSTKDHGAERFGGSRLQGEVKLVFAAPLANLEVGLGASGGSYSFYTGNEQINLFGTGVYQGIGINYFQSSSISIFANFRSMDETLMRTSGSSSVKSGKASTKSLGMGFAVWM